MNMVELTAGRALTAEEEVEAQRIADIVMGRMRAEAVALGRMLVSKSNGELFGQTEFQVRDAVHRVGAVALDAALEERKKRGIKDRSWFVPLAVATRGSKATTKKS